MRTLVLNNTNVAQGDTSKFIYKFPAGGTTFNDAELAVSNISVYYSWFNIRSDLLNNTFSYTWYFGATPTSQVVNITIPDGFYTIPDLNAYLQSVMIVNNHYLIASNGDYVYFLEFVENPTSYAVQFNSYALLTSAQATALAYTSPSGWQGFVNTNITPQITIASNAFRNIIGFNAGTYPSPTQITNYSKISDFTPQVSPVQSVLLSCSLVNNPFAVPNNIVYSFAPVNASFGSVLSPSISEFIWNKITDGSYPEFTVQFLDQNYTPLRLRDTNLVIVLSIRKASEAV